MSDTSNTTERDAHIADRAMSLVKEFGPDIERLQSAIKRARCTAAREALSTGFSAITKIVANTEWQFGDEGTGYPSPTFEFDIAGILVTCDSSGDISISDDLDDDEVQKLAEALPVAASEQDTDDKGDLFVRVDLRLSPAFDLASCIYWNSGSQEEGDRQIYPLDPEEDDEVNEA